MTSPLQQTAIKTIELESQSIVGLCRFINNDFEKAVHAIANSKGRAVISGIGKSAVIAQKIVATLNSTGSPAIFMHAADAIHGDLGIVQQEDVVIIISKSGESPEIKVLVPLIKNFKNILIGMVGNIDSYLAKQADIILNTTVEQEACPNNLAPTSSTTAQMVMGDALAVCLMELKGFTGDDFAKFHPGGNLGKRLYLTVADIYKMNARPFVKNSSSLKDVIVEITKGRLGATAVLDENEYLCGVITDGDIRRLLEKTDNLKTISAADIKISNPKKIEDIALAAAALEQMQQQDINQLIVINAAGSYLGLIHLHDLIREGII